MYISRGYSRRQLFKGADGDLSVTDILVEDIIRVSGVKLSVADAYLRLIFSVAEALPLVKF